METNRPIIRGYELRESIGAGGFGNVYRAYQPVIDREVAIKFILPQFANQPDFIRRFETEAQLVARLEHPHIVPLFDFWRDPDGAYLVMRLLRGGSLRDVLEENGKFSLENAARLLDQITAALATAHRSGVVHSDLKPDNILLDEDGNAYLSDFGISKVIGHEVTDDSVSGSLAYISPDQLRSESPSPQMDIYSLGIILYEMLTGKHPFDGDNPSQLVLHHLNDPLPDIRQFLPDLPDSLNEVIRRATAKIPTERFPDARAVATAFRVAFSPQAETAPTSQVDIEHVVNPYKGLRAFEEADAADFFGREALVETILERLKTDSRFLAVVGPSGSGKSSVVMAGLVPAIRQGKLPGSERWFVVNIVPGDQPLQKLSAALLSVSVNPPPHLQDQLRADSRGLLWAVDNLLANTEGDLLLVIDQFEEIFTLVSDENDRTHFLELLRHAAESEQSRLHVILTLRADFYDRPLLYEGFGGLVQKHTQVVLPLSADEIERAISGPAHRVGLQVDGDLIAAVVADVQEEPGALPLLQYALTEVFERREGVRLSLAAYQHSGGVLGALAKRADEAFSQLSVDQQHIARQMFLRLVTLGEGAEDTRRRARRSELLSITSDTSRLQSVLDTFGRYRLLTFDIESGTREPMVEVAHEALIRTWSRLRGWLDESRNDVRLQRLLAGAAAEWEQSKRENSFLLTGARLAQYQDWIGTTDLALTAEERVYLEASIAERQRQAALEDARLARESALERRSRGVLRALLVFMILATLGAFALTLFAFNERGVAERNAFTATFAQGDALNQAGTAQAEANSNATAQAVALNSAATATIAQGAAIYQASTAERLADEAQSLVVAAAALDAVRVGEPDMGVSLVLQANLIPNPPIEARRALVDVASASWVQARFSGHTAAVNSVTYSPDGTRVVSASADNALIIWDAQTGAMIDKLEYHTGSVNSVAYSPDGIWIASASTDKTIILWDAETGRFTRQLTGHNERVNAVEFSPDGKTLASASLDKTIILWDVATGDIIRTFEGHTNEVLILTFSADGKRILSGGLDNLPLLWDVVTGNIIRTFEGHTNNIFSVALSPNGKLAVTASRDQAVFIWDLEAEESLFQLTGHTSPVRDMVFSADSQLLITASNDTSVILWNPATGQLLRTMDGHQAEVTSITLHPDGRQAITGSLDRTLILWDVASDDLIREYRITDRAYNVAFSPDGETVLTATCNEFNTGGSCREGLVVQWDFATGEILHEMVGHNELTWAVAYGPDGTKALSIGLDGTIILWDLTTGEQIRTLEGHTNDGRAVAFSADGKTALSGADDKLMMLWDVETGQPIRTFIGHTDAVYGVAFSPDGTKAISASSDTTLILWNLETGEAIRSFQGHKALVRGVVFNADGTQILSGAYDGTMILWDVTTGKSIMRYLGHTSAITSVDRSADGRFAVSASFDRTVILWDIATGIPLRRFRRHSATVHSVAFESGSNTVALSASSDRTMNAWNVVEYPGGIINWLMNNRDVPELTCDQRQTYRIQPGCDEAGVFPTRTPFPASPP
ncbi:MAG: protein kinase [Anaerolineae bacterium]|nr:protein kinase [Anaerolineae bacterium]